MCFDEADTAIKSDDRLRARGLIELGVLIAFCKDLPAAEQTWFFGRLSEGTNLVTKEFYQTCQDREAAMVSSSHFQSTEVSMSLTHSRPFTAWCRWLTKDQAPPTTSNEVKLSSSLLTKSQTTGAEDGSDASTIRDTTETETLPPTMQQARPATDSDTHDTRPKIDSSLPLSVLGQLFIEIPESKYSECRKFLEAHLGNLDFSESQLIDEAKRRLTISDRRYARRCVQQSLLLQRWRSNQNPTRFFDALHREGSAEMTALLKDFDQIYQDLQHQVSTASKLQASSDSNPLLMDIRDRSRRAINDPSNSNSSPRESSHLSIAQARHLTTSGREFKGVSFAVPESASIPKPITRRSVAVSDPAQFDRKSQVRRPEFYTFGRVFALVWHEAAHNLDTNQAFEDTAKFGGPVFSYVRRMAVVKIGNGYCWCVPMSTYGGRGLSKPGFNSQDINDHAIIHMEGQTPRRLPSEPTTEKRPISVKPASRDQRFPAASRINFSQVHTVDFSVKAIDVGMISDGSLSDFRRYFREQLDSR